MRINRNNSSKIHEGDLTPMIDMTFQLIAFFMVLINFSQSEQNDKIQLPQSPIAKPSQSPPESPITLHVRDSGRVILAGKEYGLDELGFYLDRERQLRENNQIKTDEIIVIIRAHKDTPTGKVQDLIQKCQEFRLQTFKLRAKEDITKVR